MDIILQSGDIRILICQWSSLDFWFAGWYCGAVGEATSCVAGILWELLFEFCYTPIPPPSSCIGENSRTRPKCLDSCHPFGKSRCNSFVASVSNPGDLVSDPCPEWLCLNGFPQFDRKISKFSSVFSLETFMVFSGNSLSSHDFYVIFIISWILHRLFFLHMDRKWQAYVYFQLFAIL